MSAHPPRRTGPAWALGAAVALHAAGALAWWSGSDAPWQAPGSQAAAVARQAKHPGDTARPMALRVATVTASPSPSDTTAPTPTPDTIEGTQEPVAAPPAPATPLASGEPDHDGAGGPDTYLSRSVVDAGPQPLGLIQVPYPEGEAKLPTAGGQNAGIVGRLTLYIDEHGAVRRVQVQGGDLPPPFEAAARNAFLQARFAPAQKQGQAVKVRIDIEVRFDDQALIAAPGSAGQTRT